MADKDQDSRREMNPEKKQTEMKQGPDFEETQSDSEEDLFLDEDQNPINKESPLNDEKSVSVYKTVQMEIENEDAMDIKLDEDVGKVTFKKAVSSATKKKREKEDIPAVTSNMEEWVRPEAEVRNTKPVFKNPVNKPPKEKESKVKKELTELSVVQPTVTVATVAEEHEEDQGENLMSSRFESDMPPIGVINELEEGIKYTAMVKNLNFHVGKYSSNAWKRPSDITGITISNSAFVNKVSHNPSSLFWSILLPNDRIMKIGVKSVKTESEMIKQLRTQKMPTTVSFERPKTMMFMSDQRMEYHGLKQTGDVCLTVHILYIKGQSMGLIIRRLVDEKKKGRPKQGNDKEEGKKPITGSTPRAEYLSNPFYIAFIREDSLAIGKLEVFDILLDVCGVRPKSFEHFAQIVKAEWKRKGYVSIGIIRPFTEETINKMGKLTKEKRGVTMKMDAVLIGKSESLSRKLGLTKPKPSGILKRSRCCSRAHFDLEKNVLGEIGTEVGEQNVKKLRHVPKKTKPGSPDVKAKPKHDPLYNLLYSRFVNSKKKFGNTMGLTSRKK